jgi:glycerophosphoryl diester phosphodiesterase
VKSWPYPKLFAHRGGGSLAPENTLAAVKLGQSLGYRAHEFDVKLSKDGVAMLLHDDTLERTSTGQGRACDFTWAQLSQLDAGAWHSEKYRGEKLASFEAIAKQLLGHGDMANVEIKPTRGFERETGAAVAREAGRLWAKAEVPPLLSSFSFEALMAAKKAAPHLPRGWLVGEFADADWERLEELDAVSLHTNHKKLDTANIARLHDRGYRVMLYTVNEPDTAQELFAAGADGIFTDNLEVFRERFPEKLVSETN